jgi:hypothetical protein
VEAAAVVVPLALVELQAGGVQRRLRRRRRRRKRRRRRMRTWASHCSTKVVKFRKFLLKLCCPVSLAINESVATIIWRVVLH